MSTGMQDKHRVENLEGQIKDTRERPQKHSKVEWGSVEEEELEQDWCIRHNLSLSALRAVAETGISVVLSEVSVLINWSWS